MFLVLLVLNQSTKHTQLQCLPAMDDDQRSALYCTSLAAHKPERCWESRAMEWGDHNPLCRACVSQCGRCITECGQFIPTSGGRTAVWQKTVGAPTVHVSCLTPGHVSGR
ncbi:hypothetical protein BaRGS_00025344 [Batillaria attramentaria]|uniref:Uncharacterized protein n=1 Tax=Batillaria attramentaria TaxID=370345 RepID=A0ABD0K8J9_9CAEN